MEIAEKIKQIRAHKKFSQKEVALTVGIDRGQYSRIENGKVEPALATLRKIATALGVNMADFFSDDQGYDIDSYNKTTVERLKMMDRLDEKQRSVVFGVIDTMLANKKMKDTLSNMLDDVA